MLLFKPSYKYFFGDTNIFLDKYNIVFSICLVLAKPIIFPNPYQNICVKE